MELPQEMYTQDGIQDHVSTVWPGDALKRTEKGGRSEATSQALGKQSEVNGERRLELAECQQEPNGDRRVIPAIPWCHSGKGDARVSHSLAHAIRRCVHRGETIVIV